MGLEDFALQSAGRGGVGESGFPRGRRLKVGLMRDMASGHDAIPKNVLVSLAGAGGMSRPVAKICDFDNLAQTCYGERGTLPWGQRRRCTSRRDCCFPSPCACCCDTAQTSMRKARVQATRP